MAKNKDEFDLDEFDLDDFTIDDPMQDPEDIKDDRTPVTKISSGALKAIKQSTTSPSFYGKLLKDSLPNSYGDAFDVVDTVGSETAGLYNDAVKELKPAIRNMKRAAKIVKPKIDPVLPKWLSKKIDGLLKDDEPATEAELQVNADEAAISKSMLEVFKQQAAKADDKEVKDEIREVIETKRAVASSEQLEDIRASMHRLVSYQDGVTSAYQQKSLELKYRHFFAARDLLEVTKASTAESLTLMRGIAKNTALPDFVKMRGDEAIKEEFRDRLVGKATDFMAATTQPFIQEMMKNVKLRTKEKLQDFGGKVADSANAVEEMESAAQMMEDFGIDKHEMAGDLAGKTFLDNLAGRLGKKIRKVTSGNSAIAGTGYAARRANNSLPDMIRGWAGQSTEQYGITGDVIDFFKSIVPKESTSFALHRDKEEDLTSVAYWTGADSKSLQVIIPGLLSRLHQSSEGIRTGELPSLLTYDHKKSDFTTVREMGQRLHRSVADEASMREIDWKTDQMLSVLDSDETLTKEVRDKLRVKMMNDVTRKESFDINDYNKPDAFYGALSKDDAELVAKMFSDRVHTDEDGKTDLKDDVSQKNYLMLSNAYRGLRTSNSEAATKAFTASATGHKGILRDLGIANEYDGRDTFNNHYILDAYKDYLRSDRDYEKSTLETLGDRANVSGADTGGSGISRSVDRPKLVLPATTVAPQSDNGTDAKEKVERESPAKLGRFRSPYADWSGTQEHHNDVPWASKFDRSEMFSKDSMTTMAELLELHSSKTETEKAVGRLDEIIEIITSSNFGSGGSLSARIGGKLGRMGAGIKDGFKTYLGGVSKTMRAVGGAPLKGIQEGWKFAKKAFNWAKAEVQDVYVKGMKFPALTAAKIKEGHYVDYVTQDPIKSVSDIKGAVWDAVEERMVLTEEQFRSGIYNKDWKKIGKSGLSWVMGKMSGLLQTGKDIAFSPFRKMANLKQATKELFFVPKDVYVPGEDSPRLLGLMLLRGMYHCKVKGKPKPITSVGQIVGDVFDQENKVKLRFDEFAAGVVDVDGKPIVGLGASVINAAKKVFSAGLKAASWAKNKVMGAGKFVKDKTVGAAKWAGQKVKNVFSGDGRFSLSAGIGGGNKAYQVEQINVTKKIYNLLKNKFGIKGDDLEMTDVPGTMKDKAASGLGELKKSGFGKKLKAKKRLTVRQLRKQSAAARKKGSKLARNAKAAALRNKRRTSRGYRGWKAKMDERLASVRKNGWRETLANRKNKTKDKILGKIGQKIKNPGDGVFGKILTAVLGVGGLIRASLGKLTSLVTGIGAVRKVLTAISAAKAGGDLVGSVADGMGGGKNKGKPGILGKAVNFGKKWGGKALGVGMGLMGTVSLSGLGAGLATVGTAIGSFLASPIVIAGAAIAAVGIAGYYTYKYFKDELAPLQKVRFTQYGLPLDDSDFNVVVGEIERKALKYVKWEGGIPVNLNDSRAIEEFLALAGIGLSGGERVTRFVDWYQHRFKPVYLTHISLMKKYGEAIQLEQIDEQMPDHFKATFAKSTLFDDGPTSPYNFSVHPIAGKELVRGRDAIEEAVEDVVDKFANAKPSDKSKTDNSAMKTKRLKDEMARVKARTSGMLDAAKDNKPRPASAPFSYYGAHADSIAPQPTRAASLVKANGKLTSSSYNNAFSRGGEDSTGVYASIPQPTDGKRSQIFGVITKAAGIVHVDPRYLTALAEMESSFDPSAKAATSSAAGLFQFTRDTWKSSMEKFGDKYDIPKDATPYDPVASALLAAELMKDNSLIVENSVGESLTPGELYATHFLGAGNAVKLLNADPSTSAARLLPKPAAANRSIFFTEDGVARTTSEVLDVLSKKVDRSYGNAMVASANESSTGVRIADSSRRPSADRVSVATEKKDRLVAISAYSRKKKLALGLGKGQGSLVDYPDPRKPSQQKLLASINHIENMPADSYAQPKETGRRPATLVRADERSRKERLVQVSAQQEELARAGIEATNLLQQSLEVQRSMDGHLEFIAKQIGTMAGVSQTKPPKPATPRARNPINLGRTTI